MDEQSVMVIPLQMAMSIVVLLQLRWKRVGSGGALSVYPVLSQNLRIIFPGFLRGTVSRDYCDRLVILLDQFNGGGFKSIVDDCLVLRDTPFNHDGRPSPVVGAICPVNTVVGEDGSCDRVEGRFYYQKKIYFKTRTGNSNVLREKLNAESEDSLKVNKKDDFALKQMCALLLIAAEQYFEERDFTKLYQTLMLAVGLCPNHFKSADAMETFKNWFVPVLYENRGASCSVGEGVKVYHRGRHSTVHMPHVARGTVLSGTRYSS
ncbi:hypothetical protein TNCV_1689331 [Trichonephila clavipes]|nr:hypothetical protein TNCV_1689331 [Trichonephila clavipes]